MSGTSNTNAISGNAPANVFPAVTTTASTASSVIVNSIPFYTLATCASCKERRNFSADVEHERDSNGKTDDDKNRVNVVAYSADNVCHEVSRGRFSEESIVRHFSFLFL